MTQAFADALSRLPLTRGFAMTLARAHDYATQQAHREVTLEHLLLALAEDPEASMILQSSSIDLSRFLAEVSSHIGRNEDRYQPGQRPTPGVSPDLLRILEYSSAAARQSKRGREINGAIVMAAIVGDGKSTSAHILRALGLTFDVAIKALQRPAAPQPPTHQQPMQAAIAAPPPQDYDPQWREAPPPAYAPPPPVVVVPALPPTSAYTTAPIDHAQAGGLHAAAGPMPAPLEAHAREPVAMAYPAPPPNDSTEDILASVRKRIDAARGHAARTASRRDEAVAAPPRLPSETAAVESSVPAMTPWPDNLGIEHDVPVDAWSPENDALVEGVGPSAVRSPPPLPSPPKPRPIARAVAQSLAEARDLARLEGESAANATAADDEPAQQAGRNTHLHPIAPWPEMAAVAAPAAAETHPDIGVAPSLSRMPTKPVGAVMPGRSEPRPAIGFEVSRRVDEASNRTAALPRAAVGIDALWEFVPKVMQIGRASRVEAGISKSDLRLLARDLDGAGVAYGQDVVVSKAMSVRLRAPGGDAWIEAQSPETIWVDNTRSLARDDIANWSWNVTPRERGQLDLVLSVSARTIGADGIAAETAFPDRLLTTETAADKKALAMRVMGWIGLVLAGALLMRFGGFLLATLLGLIGRQ